MLDFLIPILFASPPSDFRDAVQEAQAQGLLIMTLGLDAARIDVDIEDGDYVLSGTVEESATRDFAPHVIAWAEPEATTWNVVVTEEETTLTPVSGAIDGVLDDLEDRALAAKATRALPDDVDAAVLASGDDVLIQGALSPAEEREVQAALESLEEVDDVIVLAEDR